MKLHRWLAKLPWWTAARRLEWYPPFRAMGVRVLALSSDWRSARLLLPLNDFNRNPGGGMFGGAIAGLADPIPALACNRVFPGYRLWTRSLQVEYVREARTGLELRFDLSAAQEADIREQLGARGRATPEFEFGFFDAGGHCCARVTNRVAIRPGDYIPAARRNTQ